MHRVTDAVPQVRLVLIPHHRTAPAHLHLLVRQLCEEQLDHELCKQEHHQQGHVAQDLPSDTATTARVVSEPGRAFLTHTSQAMRHSLHTTATHMRWKRVGGRMVQYVPIC